MYFLYQLGLILLMLCSGAEATSRVGLIVNNQNPHASFCARPYKTKSSATSSVAVSDLSPLLVELFEIGPGCQNFVTLRRRVNARHVDHRRDLRTFRVCIARN